MEQQINFLDKLECDKEDTEIVIQKLNNACKKFEDLEDKESNAFIRDKLKGYIKDLNKDIEWNEQILQELKESIDFEEQRGIY